MAKLRINQILDNNDFIFQLSIDASSVSSNDNALLEKFGEPDINLGGTFTGTGGDTTTYTIPDQFIKLVSGLPAVMRFSPVAPFDSNTLDKLAIYRITISQRFTEAFTTLRDTTDSFTGEYVTNI